MSDCVQRRIIGHNQEQVRGDGDFSCMTQKEPTVAELQAKAHLAQKKFKDAQAKARKKAEAGGKPKK